jgi:alkylhydroperoxidase/carboxymuconolactone decarboxylase family protein YurZ
VARGREPGLAFLAVRAPQVQTALAALADASWAGLPERTRVLIYLAVLASHGAERSFVLHLGEAQALGVTEQEVLGAVLTALPAVGITPLLPILDHLAVHGALVSGREEASGRDG